MATGTRKSGGGAETVLAGRHLVGIFALLVVVLGVVFTLGYLLGRSQYDTQLRAAAGPPPARVTDRTVDRNSDRSEKQPSSDSHVEKSPAPDSGAPAPPASEWDFYRSAQPGQPAERFPAQDSSQSPPSAPSQSASSAQSKTIVSDTVRPSSKLSSKALSKSSVKPGSAITPVVKRGVIKPGPSPLIPNGATVLQVAAVVRETDALALAQAIQQKKFPAFVVTPDTDHFYRVQVGPYPDAKAANAAQKRLESQGFKSIVKR